MVFLDEVLFPTSRIEVFFSLRLSDHHRWSLCVIAFRCDSLLSRMKGIARSFKDEVLTTAKLFFSYFSRYFKDHDAKIRTIFLALSGFVGFCRFLSVFVGFFLNKYLHNSQKITNFAVWNIIMKEGENGLETLGFNSPSHNPENELPQWQQKIALRAENKA